jgi:hypothetical protein
MEIANARIGLVQPVGQASGLSLRQVGDLPHEAPDALAENVG